MVRRSTVTRRMSTVREWWTRIGLDSVCNGSQVIPNGLLTVKVNKLEFVEIEASSFPGY
jgi:hypothetical protein